MGITFTNNWKNISDKLKSTLRTEFKGALPVFINNEPVSTGGQFIQLDLASTSLLQKLVGCEIREYTITMNYVYQNPNIKKSSLDHVLRYVSRIEKLMQNNISLSLTDSTAAVNCRVESTTFEEGENSYLVSFDYRCQHVSGLSETVATTPSLLNNFSMFFDGTDDYIDAGNPSFMSFGATSPFSISGWFNRISDAPNDASGGVIIGQGSFTANLSGFCVFVRDSDDVLRFQIRDKDFTSEEVTISSSAITDNVWNHFVAVRESGSVMKLYLNGSLVATGDPESRNIDTFNLLTIGALDVRDTSGASRNIQREFKGNIDEVAIWDTALSASEVSAIYNQKINSSTTLDLSYNTTDYTSANNLLAFWRMGDSRLDLFRLIDNNINGATFGSDLFQKGNPIDDNSDWTAGTGWAADASNNKLVGTSTTGNIFANSITSFSNGDVLQVTFTIENYSAGTVRFIVGGFTNGRERSGNGTYSEVILVSGAVNTLVYFDGFSSFTGDIKDITVKKYSGNFGMMTNMEESNISSEVPKQVTGLRQVTNTKSVLLDDATNEFLDAGNDSSLVPTSAMTISAWIKVNWDENPAYPRIVDKNSTSYRLAIDRLSVEKSVFFFINNQFAKSVANTLNTDNWQHVVGVFDKSLHSANKSIRIYVNGSEVTYETQQSSGSDINETTDNLIIGADTEVTTKNFNGNIDEVAIWNTALDGDAVKAIYNGGKPTDLMMANGAYDIYTADDTELAPSISTDNWTLQSQWTISNGIATYDATANSKYMYATLENNHIVRVGDMYKITFTISNVQSGKKAVIGFWNEQTANPFTVGAAAYDEGTYTIYGQVRTATGVTESNEITLVGLTSLDGGSFSVSNLSYTRADNIQAYWRMGDGTLDSFPLIADQTNLTFGSNIWNPNYLTFPHSGSTSGTATMVGDEIVFDSFNGHFLGGVDVRTVGKAYRYQFEITEYTSGGGISIHPEQVGIYVTSVGTYTKYVIATQTYVRFFINGFTGKIKKDVIVEEFNGSPALMNNMQSGDIEEDTP